MNTNQILEWIKQNVLIVVFAVVAIAAPVAMFIVSGKMNASVKETTKDRAAKIREIENLRTSVSVPGVPGTHEIAINQRFNDRYREVTEAIKKDAEAVHQAALEFNQKQHDVFLGIEAFTDPDPERLLELPKEFHEKLVRGYDRLLGKVGAGSPADPDEVAESVLQARRRFYSSIGKEDGDALASEDAKELKRRLTAVRLGEYADVASRASFYLDRAVLAIPEYVMATNYSFSQLFNWQWRFWIIDDVLSAIDRVNQGSTNVLTAPVKRIVAFDIIGLPEPTAAPVGNTGGFSSTNRGAGQMGSGPGGSTPNRGRGNDGPPARATPPNPSAAVQPDFSASFTGRTSNTLYDVIMVDLTLIVDTVRLPEVLDALAQENFMTVLDVALRPARVYDDLMSGYRYGGAPVSEVDITLETVWLREWTMKYMPDETRTVLGIPVRPEGDAAANANTTSRR